MKKKEVELLLEKDEYGRTQLFLNHDASRALSLIELGIHVNERDNVGRTALFALNQDLELVELLIEHGADASIIDQNGKNALFKCSNPQIVQLLIDHGAMASVVSNNGLTPLFGCQNADTVRLLLANGANATSIDTTNGQNALFDCTNADVANILIKYGADASLINLKGQTALFLSDFHYIGCKDLDNIVRIIHLLVENGADINAVDNTGSKALDYCLHEEIAQVLIDHGATITPHSPWKLIDGHLTKIRPAKLIAL